MTWGLTRRTSLASQPVHFSKSHSFTNLAGTFISAKSRTLAKRSSSGKCQRADCLEGVAPPS